MTEERSTYDGRATRQATSGTTPLREVLGFEERLTRLDAELDELRQMLRQQAICIGILNSALANARQCLRIAAATDLSHNDRLARLEGTRQGDLRLSEVLSGIEERLAAAEAAQAALGSATLRERLGRAPIGGEALP